MSKKFERKIIFFGNDFWDFYNKQTQKVKDRINWTFGLVRDLKVIPEKYFKHIIGTDLYEVRVSSGRNTYRIFCFFEKEKLIVILNCFQKKTQKTPKKEIVKAIKLKRQYYDEQKK